MVEVILTFETKAASFDVLVAIDGTLEFSGSDSHGSDEPRGIEVDITDISDATSLKTMSSFMQARLTPDHWDQMYTAMIEYED